MLTASTRSGLGHQMPLIRLRHMALYKLVLIN